MPAIRYTRLAAAVLTLAVAASSLAMALPAFADPPHDKKGNSHDGNHGGKGSRGGGDSVTINFNFSDDDRMVIRDYYGDLGRNGRCPPGLAKKNNGCLPPGQAKKWMMGRPLPPDVIYYSLPPSLTVRLSVPPAGYKYVRVAGDILMIAAGTGMVAAAIEDLARM
ncbi:hypothetical protein [Ferrovibrio terrae]|uniref:hypothetical protein n=1 Tax=Ferrovibrio terrae TaxID=2594003 RepID=UPI0031380521